MVVYPVAQSTTPLTLEASWWGETSALLPLPPWYWILPVSPEKSVWIFPLKITEQVWYWSQTLGWVLYRIYAENTIKRQQMVLSLALILGILGLEGSQCPLVDLLLVHGIWRLEVEYWSENSLLLFLTSCYSEHWYPGCMQCSGSNVPCCW